MVWSGLPIPRKKLGLEGFFKGAWSEGEKSPFGVTPCRSRARDTKGHPLGKLNSYSQFRNLCLQCVAVGLGGEGVSTE